MGGSQFSTGIQPIPNLSHWEQFTPSRTLHELKGVNYITYRNKFNGQLIDRYDVVFKNDEEEKIYKYQISERSQDKSIVEVLFYCHETNSQFCKDSLKAYVYIQHMPIRLKNVKEVSVSEAIYIFSAALQGLGKLYHQKGYFQLKQNHFCFNRQGELKVWMNQDLSKNYPDDVGTNSNQRSQRCMVLKLTQFLSKKLSTKQQVASFQQYITERKIKLASFQQAKRLLRCYSSDLKLVAPPRCDSLTTKCLRQKSKIKQRLTKTNLSSIKARIKGEAIKKPVVESKAKTPKQPFAFSRSPNQTMNYSIDQSRMIHVLWESAHKKPSSSHKPLSSLVQFNERKVTLADGLLSQSSISRSKKSISLSPSPSPIRSFHFHAPTNPYSFKDKILLQKQKQTNKATATSSPRGFILGEKCKYSTTDLSIEVDPVIAEDLLKYL